MSNNHLPPAENGLQLNFCKTLSCENFGVSEPSRYILQHTNPKRPLMVCRGCGAFPPLLNNQDVFHEYQRLKAEYHNELPGCNNSHCANFGLSCLSHKHLYHAFGYSGDRQRYRCKNCQSTFVDKWSGENTNLRFHESLIGLIFKGYSVREICRTLRINPKTFYDNLNHIASRCRRKLAATDARWAKHAQNYELASHFVPLQPKSNNGVYWIASGDAQSGYILCQHTNYSSTEKATGSSVHNPYDDTSRFVSQEYQPENNERVHSLSHSLQQQIDRQYQTILARYNVEDPLGDLSTFSYPAKGALIRPPYTAYAHYLHLMDLCDAERPLTIYLPQDPLLRSSAMSIFLPRNQTGRINLMYVEEGASWRMNKLSEKLDTVFMSWWRDRWMISTQKNAKEHHTIHHQKGICHLAGEENNPINWFKHATLRQVQGYQYRFQALFECFINEPRRKLRPASILPLLDIFRAWHNLCEQDINELTAAQRLGVSKEPLTIKQLLA